MIRKNIFFCQFTTTFHYSTTFTTAIHYAVVETKKILISLSHYVHNDRIKQQYMVSILRSMQRNHDKKSLLKNSPLRGLRTQYQFFVILLLRSQRKTAMMKTESTKIIFRAKLRAISLLPLRLYQDRKYIFSIQWCVWDYMV